FPVSFFECVMGEINLFISLLVPCTRLSSGPTFIPPHPSVATPWSRDHKNRQENSVMIRGATIISKTSELLVDIDEVKLSQTHSQRNMGMYNSTNTACVSWNTTLHDWDPTGCKLTESSDSLFTCECNHLTNLAVIMDINGTLKKNANYIIMAWITMIGCSISIVCLIACIFCFMFFKDIRKKMTSKLHTNMCFCLLMAELILMFGLDYTKNQTICTLVAAFLHFFFLATFTWSALEAFHMYLKIVRVFPTIDPKYWYYLLFGYGVPLVIVSITIAATFPAGLPYIRETACWLASGVIWAFAGPLALIMLGNIVIFVMCMNALWRTGILGVTDRHVKTKAHHRSKIRGSFALLSILGLTWITGFIYFDQDTDFLAYPFVILNSLQGVAIFCLLIPTDKVIRNRFFLYLNCKDNLSTKDYVKLTRKPKKIAYVHTDDVVHLGT
ncbi:unnamed protein product, partial [Meganyctiphanes norvegica]